jgi:serine/threonine protein kinase
MDVAPGTVLAGYRLVELIGRGGMGEVYRAEDPELDRQVAVKVIASGLVDDGQFRSRFERECRAAAAIDHPHVLPVYRAGLDSDRLYLAMRYVDGQDLAGIIRDCGRLDLARAAELVRQIASALDAAHTIGLVHRDVKPHNVLVVGQGGGEHAYLMDFGLTKRSASQSGLTATGQWMGTIDYVAPEQIRGDEVGCRADVYALGCMLYELLTGMRPFQRDTDVAILYAHVAAEPPRVGAAAPGLPVALDAVVNRALAKDPADRYPTAGALADAVLATTGGRTATGAETVPAPVLPALVENDPDSTSPMRYGVISAFGAAILLLSQFFQPYPDDTPMLSSAPTGAELAEYYQRARDAELLSDLLWMVGAALLLAALWAVPQLLGVSRAWAAALRTGSAAGIALLIGWAALLAAPTYRIANSGNVALLEQLWAVAGRFLDAACMVLAVTIGLTAVIAMRGARWFALIAALVAASLAAAAVAVSGPAVNAAFLATAAVTVWAVGLGMAMLRAGIRDDRMRTHRVERAAALGGLVLIATIVVSSAVPQPELSNYPGPDAGPDEIALLFQEAGGYLASTVAVNAVGVLLSIPMYWSLYRYISRTAPQHRAIAATTYAVAAAGSTVAAGGAFLSITPTFLPSLDAATIAALWDLSSYVDALSLLAAAVELTAAGLAVLRTGVLPRPFAWWGFAVAAGLAAVVVVQLFGETSILQVRNVAFFGFLCWTGALSIALHVVRD